MSGMTEYIRERQRQDIAAFKKRVMIMAELGNQDKQKLIGSKREAYRLISEGRELLDGSDNRYKFIDDTLCINYTGSDKWKGSDKLFVGPWTLVPLEPVAVAEKGNLIVSSPLDALKTAHLTPGAKYTSAQAVWRLLAEGWEFEDQDGKHIKILNDSLRYAYIKGSFKGSWDIESTIGVGPWTLIGKQGEPQEKEKDVTEKYVPIREYVLQPGEAVYRRAFVIKNYDEETPIKVSISRLHHSFLVEPAKPERKRLSFDEALRAKTVELNSPAGIRIFKQGAGYLISELEIFDLAERRGWQMYEVE